MFTKFACTLVLTMVVGNFHQLLADPVQNFDWKSSKISMYYKNTQGDIKTETVPGPFLTNLSTTSDYEKNDFWEEDGWMLVGNDFGAPTFAPNMPYFILYNKYRGLIKIFIHNSCNISRTNFLCKLEMVGGNKVTPEIHDNGAADTSTSPLFTFSANPSCFLNNYNGSAVQHNIFSQEVNLFDGWLCAEFVTAGFDPFLHQKNPKLRFSLFGLDIANVRLSNYGTLSIYQLLNQASPVGDDNDFNENSVFDKINSGYINFKDSNLAIASIQNGNKSAWVSEAVGVATIVSGHPELAPITASIAGAVTSFIGGGNNQTIPLNFVGKVQFNTTGIISLKYPITSIDFKLHGDSERASVQSSSPIPWGVFNVDTQPNVVDHITPAGSSGYIHQIVITNSPQVLVNPAIGFTAVRKGIAFTFDDAPPGMMINPAPGNPGGTYFDYSSAPSTVYTFTSRSNRLPTGMALQLLCTLPGSPVLMPRENEILKVYPIAVQQRLSASVSVSGGSPGGGATVLTAAVHDSDPATSLSYEWKFNPVWGPDPNSQSTDKERYSLQEGGTFSGASVAPGFKVSGLHTGTLTVRDGNGFSTVTPVAVTISQPREPGGHR